MINTKSGLKRFDHQNPFTRSNANKQKWWNLTTDIWFIEMDLIVFFLFYISNGLTYNIICLNANFCSTKSIAFQEATISTTTLEYCINFQNFTTYVTVKSGMRKNSKSLKKLHYIWCRRKLHQMENTKRMKKKISTNCILG